MKTDAKTKYVAKKLAEFFDDGSNGGDCACIGPSCGQLNCVRWWEMALTEPNQKLITTAFELAAIALGMSERYR